MGDKFTRVNPTNINPTIWQNETTPLDEEHLNSLTTAITHLKDEIYGSSSDGGAKSISEWLQALSYLPEFIGKSDSSDEATVASRLSKLESDYVENIKKALEDETVKQALVDMIGYMDDGRANVLTNKLSNYYAVNYETVGE